MNLKSDSEQFLQVALKLAQEAGQLILSYQNSSLQKKRKADRSIVTEADLRSDEKIRQGLQQAFPSHSILTEEAGLVSNQTSEFTWVVDPLDGTKAFAKGIPGFCVMIGLLKAGEPYLGVVVDPLEGHTYEAIQGQGAFHTYQGKRKQVWVSQRKDFSKMPLIISTGFPEKKLGALLEQLQCPFVDPINSVGIKIGLMVRQVGDIYLNHHGVHYWDTCAPQIILSEAGGIFSNMDGSPLHYASEGDYAHGGPTLASNGTRHGELVKLAQTFFQ